MELIHPLYNLVCHTLYILQVSPRLLAFIASFEAFLLASFCIPLAVITQGGKISEEGCQESFHLHPLDIFPAEHMMML